MSVEMMPILQGRAIIEAFWPPAHLDEDAYAQAAEKELNMASLAGQGMEQINAAKNGVLDNSSGATTDALSTAMGGNINTLDSQAVSHGNQADNLAMESQNIFNTKNLLNLIAYEFVYMLQRVATGLIATPGGAAALPGAQAMLQAQAQGAAGMVNSGFGMTSGMLNGNVTGGMPLGGMPASMPPALMGGMGGEAMGGYAPTASWGANPAIPQQLQNSVMGPTALSPGAGYTGQPGTLLQGMMEAAPQAASAGIEGAQKAIADVQAAAGQLTGKAADALGINLADYGIDTPQPDQPAADDGSGAEPAPATSGEDTDAAPQRGGTPPPVNPNQGNDDGPKVSAQEGDLEPEQEEPAPTPPPAPAPEPAPETAPSADAGDTAAPSNLGETSEKSADWAVRGTLEVDTPYGDFNSGAHAETQLTSAGSGTLDAPTSTSAAGAGAAPVAAAGGAGGAGAGGMMAPMGAMGAMGAMNQANNQGQNPSRVGPGPATEEDFKNDRSIVDKVADGQVHAGLGENAQPGQPLPLSDDTVRAGQVIARIQQSYDTAGLDVPNIAVAIDHEGQIIYSTSDALGMPPRALGFPAGTPLMVAVANCVSGDIDTRLFLSHWIGNSDPALALSVAAECLMIAAPRIIVTNAPADGGEVSLPNVEYLSQSLIERLDAAAVHEATLIDSSTVQQSDVMEIVRTFRDEWKVPEGLSPSECLTAVTKRRWSDQTHDQVIVATVWWLIVETEHAVAAGNVEHAMRLAYILLALPDPVRAQASTA